MPYSTTMPSSKQPTELAYNVKDKFCISLLWEGN